MNINVLVTGRIEHIYEVIIMLKWSLDEYGCKP